MKENISNKWIFADDVDTLKSIDKNQNVLIVFGVNAKSYVQTEMQTPNNGAYTDDSQPDFIVSNVVNRDYFLKMLNSANVAGIIYDCDSETYKNELNNLNLHTQYMLYSDINSVDENAVKPILIFATIDTSKITTRLDLFVNIFNLFCEYKNSRMTFSNIKKWLNNVYRKNDAIVNVYSVKYDYWHYQVKADEEKLKDELDFLALYSKFQNDKNKNIASLYDDFYKTECSRPIFIWVQKNSAHYTDIFTSCNTKILEYCNANAMHTMFISSDSIADKCKNKFSNVNAIDKVMQSTSDRQAYYKDCIFLIGKPKETINKNADLIDNIDVYEYAFLATNSENILKHYDEWISDTLNGIRFKYI